jgi:hypothetical protein
MAANSGRSVPTGKKARITTLMRNISGADVRKFFNVLMSRQQQVQPAAPQPVTPRPEQSMIRASEYLEICQENALDAYTVEDALYWHNEIITELSIELNLLTTMRWPEQVKARMATELEDRLSQHAVAVSRLASVLEKNEPLKWVP